MQAQIQSRIAEIDARIAELSTPAGVAGTFRRLTLQEPTYGEAGPSRPWTMEAPNSPPWPNGGGDAGGQASPPLPTPTPTEEIGPGSSPTSPFFSNVYKARMAAQPVVSCMQLEGPTAQIG